jgi:hypothetical protein
VRKKGFCFPAKLADDGHEHKASEPASSARNAGVVFAGGGGVRTALFNFCRHNNLRLARKEIHDDARK